MSTSPKEQHDDTHKSGEEFDAEAFAREIAELTWERKALNTVVIDLRGRVSYTDFVIICTGTSDRQIQAIGRAVENGMAEAGFKPLGREGLESGKWGLIDFGDAILHIFSPTARQEFNLESMWTDAPRLELQDKPRDLYGHFELAQFDQQD